MQALQRVFENIKLLKSCDEDQRSHIFDAMAEHNFQRGDVIIKQGDPGDYFYVIDSGEVEVTKSGKGDFEKFKKINFKSTQWSPQSASGARLASWL